MSEPIAARLLYCGFGSGHAFQTIFKTCKITWLRQKDV
jgi:hypothetical protein